MEEQLWKICPACSDIAVEGCESMTDEEVANWYTDNKVVLEEANECGSMVNYVQVPINNLEKWNAIPE
jgi:hypothetical protein